MGTKDVETVFMHEIHYLHRPSHTTLDPNGGRSKWPTNAMVRPPDRILLGRKIEERSPKTQAD